MSEMISEFPSRDPPSCDSLLTPPRHPAGLRTSRLHAHVSVSRGRSDCIPARGVCQCVEPPGGARGVPPPPYKAGRPTARTHTTHEPHTLDTANRVHSPRHGPIKTAATRRERARVCSPPAPLLVRPRNGFLSAGCITTNTLLIVPICQLMSSPGVPTSHSGSRRRARPAAMARRLAISRRQACAGCAGKPA